MSYSVEEHGSKFSTDYVVYMKKDGAAISPFHDIPLFSDQEGGTLNMVNEISRWSNAKMEINTEAPLNPIKQDVKKGKVRFVHNCFPHHGYPFNYGCFPQTWEDPAITDQHTKCNGDGDPVDVVEIGERVANLGDVLQVKVLGIMAMIDEGETDWKVIAIDVNDPLASKLNDIDDVEKEKPGLICLINEWFRIYKMPAGKPENTFAFNNAAKNKDFAMKIILETNEQWKKLISGETEAPKIAKMCTEHDCASKASADEAAAIVAAAIPAAAPTAIDPSVHKWHHVRM